MLVYKSRISSPLEMCAASLTPLKREVATRIRKGSQESKDDKSV